MRVALRVAVLLLVFGGVGWLAAHLVVSHAAVSTPQAQVPLQSVRFTSIMVDLPRWR